MPEVGLAVVLTQPVPQEPVKEPQPELGLGSWLCPLCNQDKANQSAPVSEDFHGNKLFLLPKAEASCCENNG